MTNPYVAALLPAPFLPVDELDADALALYVEGLDLLARTPGPLGEAAAARADELRPALAVAVNEKGRRPKVGRAVGPA